MPTDRRTDWRRVHVSKDFSHPTGCGSSKPLTRGTWRARGGGGCCVAPYPCLKALHFQLFLIQHMQLLLQEQIDTTSSRRRVPKLKASTLKHRLHHLDNSISIRRCDFILVSKPFSTHLIHTQTVPHPLPLLGTHLAFLAGLSCRRLQREPPRRRVP